MRAYRYTLPLSLALVIAGVAALTPSHPAEAAAMPRPPDGSPAGAYLDRVLASLVAAQRSMPQISAAAQDAAHCMDDGGTLWVGSLYQGFVDEAVGRAGGLMRLRPITDPKQLQAGDAVMIGSVQATDPFATAMIKRAQEVGALTVLFGPVSIPGAEHYIDAHAPAIGEVERRSAPETTPIVSVSIAANMWAFTSELVAALTRLGKAPTIYQSIMVPGGTERNQSKAGLLWDSTHVPPVQPGVLGRRYLARLANCVRALRATQLPLFGQAAALAAEARRDHKHTVWYGSLGHMPPLEPLLGSYQVMKPLPNMRAEAIPKGALQPGDVILYVGYYEPFGPWVETAHQAGAKIVTVLSGTPTRAAGEFGADVGICGCWPYGDSVIELPGYDVKVIPSSGVVQSAAYWALVAELQAASPEP